MADWLPVAGGALVGAALGLTGGGGSLFAVPLLVLLLGMPLAQAVPVSLLVVAATAAIGAVEAVNRGLVHWRPVLIMAGAGALLTPTGLWLGNQLLPELRLGAFMVLAGLLSLHMWRGARAGEDARVVRAYLAGEGGQPACRYSSAGELRFTPRCATALGAAGALTGTLSGLFGVGGGFLIVPVLRFVTRMSMQQAVAGSLVIISIIGGSGCLSAAPALRETGALALWFGLGSATGMLGGRAVAARLAGPTLQRTFAAALLVTVFVGLLRVMEVF